MKKYILAAVTLAAFTGMSFAQTPAAAPAPVPAAAKTAAPVKAAKPAAMKKAEVTIGEISAMDAAKNEITVKDSKGVEKTFTLEAGKMTGLTQGAKVKVMVKDGKTTVKAIKQHEGRHEGKKAAEKKAEAPKTEAGK